MLTTFAVAGDQRRRPGPRPRGIRRWRSTHAAGRTATASTSSRATRRPTRTQPSSCTRTLDKAGVAVTINDATASTPGPEVGDVAAAGIPRFADQQPRPISPTRTATRSARAASGRPSSMPQALVDQGHQEDRHHPSRSARRRRRLIGLFQQHLRADDGAEFVADIPVPAGTTDYTQFVLAAQAAGATGAIVPLGGQEAIRSPLRRRSSSALTSRSRPASARCPYADLAGLGDFAQHVVLNKVNAACHREHARGSGSSARISLHPGSPSSSRRRSSHRRCTRGSGSTRC